VLVGEVLAPLFLLLGVFTRPAALVIAINMVVAVLLAHTGHFFTLGKSGGWSLELQAFFFLTAIVIAVSGPGKYRLGAQRTIWWA
jgi:putative oxidoreductase